MRFPLFHVQALVISAFISFYAACEPGPVDMDISFGPPDPFPQSERVIIGGMPPEHVGFILYDLDRALVVRAHNRATGFIPASTSKVPTAITALDVLGPDHRFETILGYRGSVRGGTLHGDLWLKGTGEPLLGVGDLMGMIDDIERKGIVSVSGKFFFDESELAVTRQIDEGMDQDVSYNAGLSALSLDYNSIVAEWKRERKSDTTDIYLIPTLPMNRAGISGDTLRENVTFAYRDTGGIETWLLSPGEKSSGSDRLPVKRPGLYTAQLFAKLCAMRGITLPPPEAGTMPGRARTLSVHRGGGLAGIIDTTLTYSINLTSELMLLSAAKKISGKALTLDESGRVMEKYLSGRMRGVRWEGLRLANGSGLTATSRISPEQMLAFLAYADSRDYGSKRFRYLLPASGWTWSLARRLGRPETAFHVWAKTGTINFAQGLAGYLHTSRGRNMAFVVFVNDIETRRRYDGDPDRRNKEWSRRVAAWHNGARSVMDGLVTAWIREL